MAAILLIDDDELVRATLSAALENQGYRTVVASDGREGLEKFRADRFDLVVTDIVMPGKEGLEVITQIRAEAPEMPIIAISGGGRHTNRDFLQVAEALGVSSTLHKPFLPSQLLRIIGECLGGAHPAGPGS